MADKFYQFHYAEMDGTDVLNLGVINCHLNQSATKDNLTAYAKAYLKKENANILISHVSKLRKEEYEKLTGVKVK